MSHPIDFRSHDLRPAWNGRRAISECGFKIINVKLLLRQDGIRRQHLTRRWKNLSDQDFSCAEAFVQAQKL